MKRRLLAAVLVFRICTIPFSACADEEVTVESVIEKMEAFPSTVESTTYIGTINLDAALKVDSEESPERSLGIGLTGGYDMKILNDRKGAIIGSVSLNVVDLSIEADMELYASVSEDEKNMDNYVNVTIDGAETGWQHTTTAFEKKLKNIGLSGIEDLSSPSIDDVVDWNWELSEVGDNYLVSGSLNFSDMVPFLEADLKSEGVIASEEKMNIVKSLKINMTYTLDKETCAPLSCHINFNDSDVSVLDDLLAAFLMGYAGTGAGEELSIPEVSLELNDLSMDMTMSYNDVDEILVPAGALAAETIDVNEMVSEAESAVEDTTEAATEKE